MKQSLCIEIRHLSFSENLLPARASSKYELPVSGKIVHFLLRQVRKFDIPAEIFLRISRRNMRQ